MKTVEFKMQADVEDGAVLDVRLTEASGEDNVVYEAMSAMSELLERPEGGRGVWPYQRLRDWAYDGGVTVGNDKSLFYKVGPASLDLSIDHYYQRPRWYWRNPFTRWLLWHTMPGSNRDIKKAANELFYWTDRTIFDTFVLWPGEFILLSTVESVTIPDDAFGITRLKSTSGRSGLEQMDAGLLDPGFVGTVTLEFFNAAPWPLELRCHDYYVQMAIFDLSEVTGKPYRGRYQHQGVGPVTPREEVFYG